METAAKMLTTREVAVFLNVHESTVYRLVAAGQLPGFRVGDWRFPADELSAWIKRRTINLPGSSLAYEAARRQIRRAGGTV